MLLHAPTTNSSLVFITKHNTKNTLTLLTIPTSSSSSCTPLRSNPTSTSAITTTLLAAAASACLVLTAVVGAGASVGLVPSDPPDAEETLSNVPQTLSGECLEAKDCKKARIQRPKSRKAETCTVKCVTTCIRGGDGSPGEGPLNIRRPLVVFKPGFRSRQYWFWSAKWRFWMCHASSNAIGSIGKEGQTTMGRGLLTGIDLW